MSERRPHGYWKKIAAEMGVPSSKTVFTRSEGNALVGAILRMSGSASLRKTLNGFVVIRTA